MENPRQAYHVMSNVCVHVVSGALDGFDGKRTLHMGCACAIDFMEAEDYLEVHCKSDRIEGQGLLHSLLMVIKYKEAQYRKSGRKSIRNNEPHRRRMSCQCVFILIVSELVSARVVPSIHSGRFCAVRNTGNVY